MYTYRYIRWYYKYIVRKKYERSNHLYNNKYNNILSRSSLIYGNGIFIFVWEMQSSLFVESYCKVLSLLNIKAFALIV